ncbi:MAG: multiheme c-type cytochrome [Candidatus Omnitrophota bacterium]
MGRLFALILLAAIVSAGTASVESAEPLERYYVGETACRQCHNNIMGKRNQFNPWRLSAHSRAYAALAMPEAKEIAKLSGIAVDPFDSPICLGCHATASQTEAWQRDEKFYIEDGVQCEMCHGPGSAYSEENVMANKEQAMKAGLRMPDDNASNETTCLVCHKEKGSHTAVIKVKKFDFKQALCEIDHSGRGGEIKIKTPSIEPLPGPTYVGVMVCAKCHRGEEKGYPFSKWRLSSHANAYAILGTTKAEEIARNKGIESNPQEAAECLKCHSTGGGEPAGRFMESFDIGQGVQCESCHGPGSEYIPEAVMNDPIAARQAGLQKADRETCLKCHPKEIDGKPFDFDAMWKKIEHGKPPERKAAFIGKYKTPFNLEFSRDGKRLYVACEASDSVIVLDPETSEIVSEFEVQDQPHDIALSRDEKFLYVSNRGSDTVSVIDAATLGVLFHISVGDEPHELMTDGDGHYLYVANAGSYDVSVVDLRRGAEAKRLSAGRGAWGIARSPDGKRFYLTNNLSHFIPFRTPCRSEVTVINSGTGFVENRIVIPEANMVQGVDVSPDGEFALVTLIRTKNLVPMTRVIQGWVMNNGFGVLWKDGRVDQLLLDEIDGYFADPTDVVFAPDGKYAYVTGGGINAVAVIDIEKMKALLDGADPEYRRTKLPNNLGVSVEYVLKRISVGRSPRGMAVSPDGKFVYVADGLDDAVSVIDIAKQERVKTISLGGPQEITIEREGERIFHSAEITLNRQFSCHSCHPDGGIDGITYDIEPDGVGFNPVDNRTLRGILDTAPFKWEGTNPSLRRQCGPRLAVFFTRSDPFTLEQANALDRYICTIPLPPNRYRAGSELTPAQWNGKLLFERDRTNGGEEIPVKKRCVTCHPAPFFTNRNVEVVGSKSWLDTNDKFDVPQLNNIYESAPFLHDGRAETLEEIWTRFNPYDEHGVTNDMTKDQLKDLIEYLKTL